MTSPSVIDSHCHIDFDDFDNDRSLVVNRAHQLGVSGIIVPGVAKSSWNKTISVCNAFDRCHLALGLHPVFIEQHQPHHLIELDTLVNQHHPIAIGEIGLDYFLPSLDKKKQQVYFSKQLVLAQHHHLPNIIHNRKAHDDAISMIKEIGSHGGIIHAFNGSVQQAWKYIELGFLLGFGGMLTFERSTKLKKLVQTIPIEHIALETDAPDMTVSQHQGKRNSPEYIPLILKAVADAKQLAEHDVATQTTDNVKRLFNLNDDSNQAHYAT